MLTVTMLTPWRCACRVMLASLPWPFAIPEDMAAIVGTVLSGFPACVSACIARRAGHPLLLPAAAASGVAQATFGSLLLPLAYSMGTLNAYAHYAVRVIRHPTALPPVRPPRVIPPHAPLGTYNADAAAAAALLRQAPDASDAFNNVALDGSGDGSMDALAAALDAFHGDPRRSAILLAVRVVSSTTTAPSAAGPSAEGAGVGPGLELLGVARTRSGAEKACPAYAVLSAAELCVVQDGGMGWRSALSPPVRTLSVRMGNLLAVAREGAHVTVTAWRSCAAATSAPSEPHAAGLQRYAAPASRAALGAVHRAAAAGRAALPHGDAAQQGLRDASDVLREVDGVEGDAMPCVLASVLPFTRATLTCLRVRDARHLCAALNGHLELDRQMRSRLPRG